MKTRLLLWPFRASRRLGRGGSLGGLLSGLTALLLSVFGPCRAATTPMPADTAGIFVDGVPATLSGTWEVTLADPVLGVDGLDELLWKPIRVPGTWQSQGIKEHGTVWYRLRFELDPAVAGTSLAFVCDEIRDADETYLDGQLIGKTGGFPPHYEKAPRFVRIYQLPANLSVRPGPHWLAIRVYNPGPMGGGIIAEPSLMPVSQAFFVKTRVELPFAFLAAAMASLGLFSLFFFLRDRSQPDALFYFLATTAAAATLACSLSFWVFFGAPLSILFRISESGVFLVLPIYLLFFLRFFERPVLLRHRILLQAQIVGTLFCWFWPRIDDLYFAVPAGFLMAILITGESLTLLAQDARRRAPWARVLFSASFLLLLALNHDVIASLLGQNLVLYGVRLFVPAFFLLMTAYLPAMADRFAVLRHRASTDPLTGLANRAVLFDRITLELARARRSGNPVALALLDLDHFKQFNDRFGHLAGDRLLMGVAKAITSSIRETDLGARFGGEEFAILLPEVNASQALLCLERVRLMVAAVRVSGAAEGRTISAGIAVFDPEVRANISVTAWLRQADAALYKAKEKGRNQTVVAEGDPPGTSSSGAVPLLGAFRKTPPKQLPKVG